MSTTTRTTTPNWDKTTVESRAAYLAYLADPNDETEAAFYAACADAGMPDPIHHNYVQLVRTHIVAFAEMDALHEEALAMHRHRESMGLQIRAIMGDTNDDAPNLVRTTQKSREAFDRYTNANGNPGWVDRAKHDFYEACHNDSIEGDAGELFDLHLAALRECETANLDFITGTPLTPVAPVTQPLYRALTNFIVRDNDPADVATHITTSHADKGHDCKLAARIAACLNFCRDTPTAELQQHNLTALLERTAAAQRTECADAMERLWTCRDVYGWDKATLRDWIEGAPLVTRKDVQAENAAASSGELSAVSDIRDRYEHPGPRVAIVIDNAICEGRR